MISSSLQSSLWNRMLSRPTIDCCLSRQLFSHWSHRERGGEWVGGGTSGVGSSWVDEANEAWWRKTWPNCGCCRSLCCWRQEDQDNVTASTTAPPKFTTVCDDNWKPRSYLLSHPSPSKHPVCLFVNWKRDEEADIYRYICVCVKYYSLESNRQSHWTSTAGQVRVVPELSRCWTLVLLYLLGSRASNSWLTSEGYHFAVFQCLSSAMFWRCTAYYTAESDGEDFPIDDSHSQMAEIKSF